MRRELQAEGQATVNDFIEKSETRLNEIIREAKKLNYELQVEPISKLYFSSSLMEAHFINGNAKKDVIIWENKNSLGEDLYDILDKKEGDLKTYLTQRIQAKWRDFDAMTKKENILTRQNKEVKKDDLITPEQKASMQYGL